MAVITPYVTDKFTAYLGDVISTTLSLAVWLNDDYEKAQRPFGNIKVNIKEGDIKAVKNLSGYYLFSDLTHGNYTIVTESDFYFSEETPVNTSLLDPKNPVVEIALKPKPAYPFPSYATLARGLVSDGSPVVDAEVTVVGKTIETLTDEKGEFILYFKGIEMENITIEIKKGSDTKSVNTTIEEGKTKSLGIIPFP
jgi:hypothetical protein